MEFTASNSIFSTSTECKNAALTRRCRRSLRDKILLKLDGDIDQEFDPKTMMAGIVTWIDDRMKDAVSFEDDEIHMNNPMHWVGHIAMCPIVNNQSVDPPLELTSLDHTDQERLCHSSCIEEKISVAENCALEDVIRNGDIVEPKKVESRAVIKKNEQQPLYLADQIPEVENLFRNGKVSTQILHKMNKVVGLGQVGNTILSSSPAMPLYTVRLVVKGKGQSLDINDGTLVIAHGHSEDEALINAMDILRHRKD